MNNGLKPSKVTVNIETMPYFSASIAQMHISPVSRVVLGTPEAAKNGKLEINIVGKCKDVEFIRRADFVKDCFYADSHNLKNTLSCNIDFDFDSFEYDNVFLNSLEEETMAEIYVLVNYCGTEYVTKSHILLLPADTWLGLDGEPSVISSFIREDATICSICESLCEDERISYSISSKKTITAAIKELYKRLKNCNIIYTRPVGYAANAKQQIRSADVIFGGSSVLATPLEIATVFSSCARKIGFDTSLLFVRGKKGEIFVLCGIYLVKSPIDVPVFENAERIKAMIEAGDMLIVDPSVFAAAQNTSFVMALEQAAENFSDNIANLVCMIDVESAKKCAGEAVFDEYAALPVKNAVARVYSSLVSAPVMQIMSGKKREEIEEIPLLLADFDSLYKSSNEKFKLLPLDFNVDLTDFAAIDKDFSSILTMSSPKSGQHFSQNELVRIEERFSRLKEKITRDGEITTSCSEEALYRIASSMAFGKNKREPYFAFGYVKITDKLTETVSFAPICLVRANLEYENGNFYVNQVGHPIVNKVFIRNALKDSALGYDSFMKSLMPTDKTEIFDMFENIRMALMETDDRHVYEIVKEAHIINVEIDDYVLWSNLALLRKKMSASENVSCVFENGHEIQEHLDLSYVPAFPLYSQAMKAVIADTSMVVEGGFTGEKESVFAAQAAKSISAGKSTLVVTDDMEMSGHFYSVLCEKGLSDMAVVVDEDGKAYGAVKRIADNIEKYKNEEEKGIAFVNSELVEANNILLEYTERINRKQSMGMSLKEAEIAYLSASAGTVENDDIPVDKKIFEYADESKLDNIFERVGELITIAGNLCKRSELPAHTPLKNHPLFNTNPRDDIDEEVKEQIREAIWNALPVLSEYRDVFLDVNEILGFDERDVDCFYKLEKLNDLYKLVLTARDIDIPEKFVESDIADFSKSKRFETENKKRMEAIEFKLNFFSHEIFEDVETLLRGDEYDEVEEKGFLKKFMLKKNSQETLMQYVLPEKKSDFQQHKLSEIYKLLYEYKSCVIALRQSGFSFDDGDDSTKLAKISEKAAYIVSEISSPAGNRKKLLSNVFRLISVIPVDAALARKITMVRARLAELYSGENSVTGFLSASMGIDFSSLVFENGILSFDGIGKYLEEIEKKLELTDLWLMWLKKANEARDFVPGFVKYLEEYGAGTNVDRIFAKSLLSPVAECVKNASFEGFSAEKLGKAKDKYISLLNKACDLSYRNTFEAYKKSVKHMAQTNVVNPEEYANVSFKDLFSANTALVQKVLPIVIVTKNMLSEVLPFEAKFDTVCVIDNKDNGFSMLPALAYGTRGVVINMSRTGRSSLALRFAKNVPCYNVCTITDRKDPYLFAWLNESVFDGKYMVSCMEAKSNVELVRMNGTYERTVGRTNKTEAELAIVKATGLLQDENASIVITAFTKEQCTAVEKLVHVLCKKNKILDKAIKENRVSVCTPDRLYMKKYDSLVVCTCFGADKDGRIGWDFGYGAVTGGEAIPEAYISIADRLTEKTYILSSLNVRDARFMRRTGNNASVFNSFCEILSDGRIPFYIERTDASKKESILCDIMSCIEAGKSRAAICEGKQPLQFALRGIQDNDLYILCDNDMDACMHDELLVKDCLEKDGKSVTTLTPMLLVGETLSETIKSLVAGNDKK